MENKIIVITGPSAIGKTTISNLILSFNKTIEKAKSVSTRKKREEIDEYEFVTVDDFKDKIINNELIEFEEVYNNTYYGTLKSELNRIVSNNKIPLLVLNVKGAITIKKIFKEKCISIFLNVSDKVILKDRLIKRGSDSNIDERLEKIDFEISLKDEFDYEINNDDIYKSFERINKIINDNIIEKKSETLIVNFYAGPGAGKSSMASGVFSELKWEGVESELVQEYAKDLVWGELFNALNNQIDVFGNQHKRLFRLFDKVDVIVTDSPLLLQTLYSKDNYLNALITNVYKSGNNLDIFLNRVKEYNPKGRTQTKEEAIELDKNMKKILTETGNEFYTFNGEKASVEKVVKLILEKLKKDI